MSKASSKAMTSSTVSRESAPKSSTKEAVGVTSASSTPNCSTMICFTFSSTEAIVPPLRIGLNAKSCPSSPAQQAQEGLPERTLLILPSGQSFSLSGRRALDAPALVPAARRKTPIVAATSGRGQVRRGPAGGQATVSGGRGEGILRHQHGPSDGYLAKEQEKKTNIPDMSWRR